MANLATFARRYAEFNEGRRNRVYKDTLGIPTVGVGFNLRRADARERLAEVGASLDAVLSGRPLTDEQVDKLANGDVQDSLDFVRSTFADFDGFGLVRQVILADLALNLGATRFLGFRKMVAAVRAKDWRRAADEMRLSMWFHQVGKRGPRNVEAMRSGVLPADFIRWSGLTPSAEPVQGSDEQGAAMPQPGIEESPNRGLELVRPPSHAVVVEDQSAAGRIAAEKAETPRRMEVVYVAGPYRSKDGMYGVKKNIDAAIDVARTLWVMGYVPICPHANSYMMDGADVDPEVFLDGDLELVRRSDSVCLLPGWEKSDGARGEVFLALDRGMPIKAAFKVDVDGAEPWGFSSMTEEQVYALLV